jgi:4-carboxymuconolactone decarboxylase
MKVIKVAKINRELLVKPLFAGRVTQQTIIDETLSNRFAIRQVNFDKGARNKFHSHSIEQILIVTEGEGIVATDKEEVMVVPGDIVCIPANEKHWHGATKDSTFSHLYVMVPEQKTTQLED